MLLLSIIILLFVIYSAFITYFRYAWKQIPDFDATGILPATKVSVIIPARNEENNIGKLLSCLQQQNYPKELLEIIVVDDHSNDNTATIVKQFPEVFLLPLRTETINSYKKKAVETGIACATGSLIITTDADCSMGNNWVQTIVSCQQKTNATIIAAPVAFTECGKEKFWLHNFQVLDFLVLQGVTGAVVYKKLLSMCNGANLAYTREAFMAVNGFSNIDHIASGDDMLLMHKINLQFPGRTYYLKSTEAIVFTNTEKSWSAFFNQRIRWASKAPHYKDRKIFYVLLIVYLFNFSFLVLLIAGFFHYNYWAYLIFLWIAKTLIEFPFVNTVAGFFKKQSLMKYFFILQPLHIFYTLIAGWLGHFGKYTWKGRTVQ